MKRLISLLLLAALLLTAGCRKAPGDAAPEAPVEGAGVYRITTVYGSPIEDFLGDLAAYSDGDLAQYLLANGLPEAGDYFRLTLRPDGTAAYSTVDLMISPKQDTGTWSLEGSRLTLRFSAGDTVLQRAGATLTGTFQRVSLVLRAEE